MTVTLPKLYHLLQEHFGKQDWWPIDEEYHLLQGSDPRFEIMIGAILTQNTAWTNVEKTLNNLKQHQALTIQAIVSMDDKKLRQLIQSSGFFNQKTQRLKEFSSYLHKNYHDNLTIFFSRNTLEIRKELLSLKGIGPETANSMLLYAGNHPVFVIDAYTKRISTRLPLPIKTQTYDDIQHFFEQTLQQTFPQRQLLTTYKELHALFVELAKNFCKKKPVCTNCPLTTLCKKIL